MDDRREIVRLMERVVSTMEVVQEQTGRWEIGKPDVASRLWELTNETRSDWCRLVSLLVPVTYRIPTGPGGVKCGSFYRAGTYSEILIRAYADDIVATCFISTALSDTKATWADHEHLDKILQSVAFEVIGKRHWRIFERVCSPRLDLLLTRARHEIRQLPDDAFECWSIARRPSEWLAILKSLGREMSLSTFNRLVKKGELRRHPDSNSKNVRLLLADLPVGYRDNPAHSSK